MPARSTVRLVDPELLRRTMAARGFTVRSLADRTPASKSAIGHLVTGAAKSTSVEVATSVEDALGVPGLLFQPSPFRSSEVIATDGDAA